MKWTTTRPTTPGNYLTRYANPGGRKSDPITVRVERRGRGLRVVPIGPWPHVPMSAIEDGELEWGKE